MVVDADEVPRLLPMAECIDAVEAALVALARGEAELPLRTIVWLPEGVGALVVMPAYIGGDIRAAGAKVISVFPGNEGTELDAHQGAVLLFEGRRGRLVAIADATEITAIRTAAVSAVATRVLARESAGDLALLGSGTQARTHLESIRLVRDVRRVRVWSRSRERAEAFAEREGGRHGIKVEVAASPEACVRDADILCTTTSAREPILHGRWVAAGAHVNAVGFAGPQGRELDAEAVARARLFADRRESALAESGDVRLAIAEGAIDETHLLGEIGEVLTGMIPGRRSDEEVTVFESLGLAIEDLAAIHRIAARAEATASGKKVPLSGTRRR